MKCPLKRLKICLPRREKLSVGRAFQVKTSFEETSKRRKQLLLMRLKHDECDVTATPEFSALNINYEVSERISAISCGGIGAVHQLVQKIGLDKLIDDKLFLLKYHKPYHESDHILNIAYNITCGGECLEDLELLRNNAAYLDALGARRIPDPTTAGDFLRRFGHDDVLTLADINNRANQRVWRQNPANKERDAILDIDGKIAETGGEQKEKMDMSYKGLWGFDPLIITEATTGAHLFVVNRTGSAVSHDGAVPYIDKAIALVRDYFRDVQLRGDGDFSLTVKFDKWDAQGVKFSFSYNAMSNLVKIAENQPKNAWEYHASKKNRTIKTKPRKRKSNVKRQVIERREYRHQERLREYVAEFDYTPEKCSHAYRIVVIKRIIKITKGHLRFKNEIRYFFYITNIRDMTASELVHFSHGRCNHENKIAQLNSGVNALKMPASEFNANWAYMTICALAWNFKSWLGQIMPDAARGEETIRMEYKRFRYCLINIPCQIVMTGRVFVYRILNFTPWIETFWNMFRHIKMLRFASD